MTVPMPVEISDATLAFPANALDFMPAWEDIPVEYKDHDNPWVQFQRTWFGYGLSQRFSYTTKAVDPLADPDEDGVETFDAVKVYRQLAAIQGSYAPKHEHKMAAVGYLADCWIHELIYGRPETPDEELTVLGPGSREEWLEHFRQRDAGEVELQRMDGK